MINETTKKIVIRCRAVIVYNNKLLVVKHAPSSSFYSLPGGHLEYAENIHDAMKREIIEELGIEPQIGRLLYVNNFIEEVKQSIEFFFEITNPESFLDTENLSGTHRFELSEICWVDKNDNPNILPKSIQEDLKNDSILSNLVRFLN